MIMSLVILFIVGAVMVNSGPSVVHARPRKHEQHTPETDNVTDAFTAMSWLSSRGWISESNSRMAAMVDLRTYLTNFQNYANIPETGILDQVTKDKMNSPRCGVPDWGPEGFSVDVTTRRQKRYAYLGDGQGWPKTHLTWYLRSGTRDMTNTDIKRVLNRAFKYWQDVSALTFAEASDRHADILLDFYSRSHSDGWPFDGRGNTLAHAFAPGRGIGGDVHFDDDEIFTSGVPSFFRGDTSFLHVAVHEIGHSLGLGHTNARNNAIMAPFYSYTRNLVLGQDDIAGIQSLYGPPPPKRPEVKPVPPLEPVKPTVSARSPEPVTPSVHCISQRVDAAFGTPDGTVFLFRAGHVFKVRNLVVEAGYPKRISTEFPGAPSHVDAVLYYNEHLVFIFKGVQYWRYEDGRLSDGRPRRLSDWGLGRRVDAVIMWPGSSRIYFFKGQHFYRYDAQSMRMDHGYPKSLSLWTGVVGPVKAALNFNGHMYFFGEGNYQRFDITKTRMTQLSSSVSRWFGCSSGTGRGESQGAVQVPTTTTTAAPTTIPPPQTTTTTTKPTAPPATTTITTVTTIRDRNQCSGRFDAITKTSDGSMYAFRGNLVFRFDQGIFGVEDGFPADIHTVFRGLPNDLDAAVFWEDTGKTYFFKGSQYYRYTDTTLDPGYPKSIALWNGVPTDVDAAFVWSGNGETYFIKGNRYYHYDKTTAHVKGNSRPLAVWGGLPSSVDSAFQWNHKTFFFAGENYYPLNDRWVHVEGGFPRSTAQDWLLCR